MAKSLVSVIFGLFQRRVTCSMKTIVEQEASIIVLGLGLRYNVVTSIEVYIWVGFGVGFRRLGLGF